jgi:hypothetical protein
MLRPQVQIVRGIAIIAVIAFTLAGCAAMEQQQRQEKMKVLLDPYLGRSIADHVVAKGPPTSVTDLAPNRRLYRWVWTSQTAGALVPVGGSIVAIPSQQQQCIVSLTATSSVKQSASLQDWIIDNWNWEGAC